ncbi:uncharacterized protein LOC106648405 [Trichogramma pretiosum]|uniref:uncharacterized protein LOC106648405 n=1 Tax=Trichogramma pretiosum TaxID=7493 RepID=UPI0006C98D22|nr:uncharacterized protein LOC106648405 [Trichogramma pretiosum]XP_014220779.1 uncharacterized protein LOC106648405 [Trichogramma pretiosum]XP_023314364.1 uncharacterized protein LOC106648405 [Trichogramma pretiosum]
MSDSEETDVSYADWNISRDWLEGVLQEYLGKDSQPEVVEFTIRPGCNSGESVLSDILAIGLEYRRAPQQAAEQINLIVKRLPQDPYSRFFVTEAQFDLREIRFYTQVIPDLEVFQRKNRQESAPPIELPIARCIHAHYSPASGSEESPEPPESYLVLENLASKGYESAEFSRGLTLKQAEAALDAIARLHALSLTLKVKEGKPLNERYPFLFQTARATDSYQQLVERGLPQLARFLERRPGLEAVLEALLALRPRTKEVIANLLAPEDPLALITHTDFWCNNLLFRANDDGACECAILDWQMVTYSRPTNDVALLVVSSLPTELRRRHTSALLDGYWNSLTGSCSTLGLDVSSQLNYTRSDLDRDYRRSTLLALLLCIGSVDVALGDPMTEQRLIDVLEDLQNEGVLAFKDVVEQQQQQT